MAVVETEEAAAPTTMSYESARAPEERDHYPTSEPRPDGPTQWTTEALLDMDPVDFEHLVGEIWKRKGYAVRGTPATGDEGIDLMVEKRDPLNPELIAIQCKRHSNPVGRPDAQTFVGATSADSRWSKGVLVAVSGFSHQCIQYAKNQGRLELWDGETVCRYLNELDIPRR